MLDKEHKEDVLKAEAKRARDEIKKIQHDISFLSSCIRDGSEPRQVQCKGQVSIHRNVVELVRQDTGEIVDSRPLTFEERQASLPIGYEDMPQATNVRIIKR